MCGKPVAQVSVFVFIATRKWKLVSYTSCASFISSKSNERNGCEKNIAFAVSNSNQSLLLSVHRGDGSQSVQR